VNVFAQDTIALRPDQLDLVLGLKYEKTDYAPAEWLPNVRLAWTPDADHTLWAAVSEATRVPSRIESDLTFFQTIRLGTNFGPERVRSYELGWRERVVEPFWYDVVLFYSDFDDLRTGERGGPLGNGMYGHSHGAEVALRWQPLERLRIDGAYTRMTTDLALDATSTATAGQARQAEGLAPRNQASLRMAFDAGDRWRLDATLRHVGELRGVRVPAYTELDLAVNVDLPASLALTFAATNLLHAHHAEQGFATSATGLSTEVERAVSARLVWVSK
jgi:iron complex outermembrane receptor protein